MLAADVAAPVAVITAPAAVSKKAKASKESAQAMLDKYAVH
jgi:hypothetical protein